MHPNSFSLKIPKKNRTLLINIRVAKDALTYHQKLEFAKKGLGDPKSLHEIAKGFRHFSQKQRQVLNLTA